MAIGMLALFMDWFREFVPISISLDKILLPGIGLAVFLSLLTDFFPAAVLTNQPVFSSIKGKVSIDSSKGSMTAKSLLVAVQLLDFQELVEQLCPPNEWDNMGGPNTSGKKVFHFYFLLSKHFHEALLSTRQ